MPNNQPPHVPTPADLPTYLSVETCDNGHTLRLSQLPHRLAIAPVFIYVEPWPLLMIAARLILAMAQQQQAASSTAPPPGTRLHGA